MGPIFDRISTELSAWIARQPMFFVATAPSDGGRVNLSPKGLDTFRVLGERKVAYLDLTGSGVETIAHLRQNGRITFMFCAFEGPPRILRIFGNGEPIVPADERFPEAVAVFEPIPGIRSVIVVDVDSVRTSCGFGVPEMQLVGQRERLEAWAVAKGEERLEEYRATRNAVSIDGLPGFPPPQSSG